MKYGEILGAHALMGPEVTGLLPEWPSAQMMELTRRRIAATSTHTPLSRDVDGRRMAQAEPNPYLDKPVRPIGDFAPIGRTLFLRGSEVFLSTICKIVYTS